MRITSLLLSIIMCSCFISCQKEKVIEGYITETSPNKIITEGKLLPTTIPITSEEEFFLTQVDSATYTLDNRAEIADDIQVGSVIGGGLSEKFPEPYLKYVEEVIEDGNTLRLKVRQAGLMEAFTDLNIDLEITEPIVDTRELSAKFGAGPVSLNFSGGGTVSINNTVDITYDKLVLKFKSTGTTLDSIVFGVQGLQSIATFTSDMSGTINGNTVITVAPPLSLPIPAVVAGLPIVISNRLLLKAGGSINGSGSINTEMTSTSDKIDLNVEYDGQDLKYSTNAGQIAWNSDPKFDVNNANGHFEVEFGPILEYQLSLYEAYQVGHLYFNINPINLALDAEKNPTQPFIEIETDYVAKMSAGLRGGLGLEKLFNDGATSGPSFFSVTGDYSIEILNFRANLRNFSVPISCPLDTKMSTLFATCNTTTDMIDLNFRWDAGPSVMGNYFLSIGESGGDFFTFNEDHSLSFNPSVFGISNQIVFEHEDYEGCRHEYLINNPCLETISCPNGNCWMKLNDGKTWTTQNSSDTGLGECHPSDVDCQILGEYYTRDELLEGDSEGSGQIQGICKDGWHIPSYQEYSNLISAYQTDGINALLTPGITGVSEWSTDIASGFSAFPSGSYHPWITDTHPFEGTVFESDDKIIMYWTSDSISGFGDPSPVAILIELQTKKVTKIRVTENLALPCRCVQN